MAANYLYKKIYEQTLSGTLHLSNPEPALAYCNEKLNQLLNVQSREEERRIKLSIFSEFTEIYEYDCANAVRPEPFGSFESPEEKQDFIRLKQLVQDFYLYIGNIFCSYHEELAKRKQIPLIDFRPMVIDYNELYQRAVNEYFGTLLGVEYPLRVFPVKNSDKAAIEYINGQTVKYVEYRGVVMPVPSPVQGRRPEPSPHAPGATFILPALIEHSLLMYLQNRLLFAGLDGMRAKVQNGERLSAEEKPLFEMFTMGRQAGAAIFSGSKEQAMMKLYQMFVRHGVINDSNDLKKVLTGKGMTIGAIFHSDYAKSVIRPEYYSLLEYLFDTKKMNIRNCIMHGNSVTYDYLAIGIASVMLQLLWDIANNDVLRER